MIVVNHWHRTNCVKQIILTFCKIWWIALMIYLISSYSKQKCLLLSRAIQIPCFVQNFDFSPFFNSRKCVFFSFWTRANSFEFQIKILHLPEKYDALSKKPENFHLFYWNVLLKLHWYDMIFTDFISDLSPWYKYVFYNLLAVLPDWVLF